MKLENKRKFEIPYNFDPNYIDTLVSCGLVKDNIKYIYVAPFVEDYITVVRDECYPFSTLTREEYVNHINKIKSVFSGKMQLLLQKKDKLMDEKTLKWYIDLGFTSFCCGSKEQARIIKNYDKNLTIIGSILMHITRDMLYANPDYKNFFDALVLDFSYGRNLQKIKLLPEGFDYIILINSYCNSKCDGDHHWYVKNVGENVMCPGRLCETGDFDRTVLIRPMDLHYFDPYISVYKIQDRSWSTEEIIRDIILYTTDFNIYPGIEYSELIYNVEA